MKSKLNKLRAGIIGCGNVYHMHARALKKLDMVELIAVCDVKEDRVETAKKEYGVIGYSNYEEMFATENLDVVHICLPHYLHESATISAAKHGINVLTEKPMSISVESAERMIEASKLAGIKLGVIFQNRYTNGAKTLKNLIETKQLGKILAGKCQVTWSRNDEYYSKSDWKGTWEKEGGGVIIDQAIHTLDLINWLLNEEPISVEATIRSRAHEKVEVEDFAEGIIKYDGGTIISFMANNYYSFDAPVEVEFHTEKAVVRITGARLQVDFFDGKESLIADIPEDDYLKNGIVTKTYWGTGHVVQIEEFYHHVLGKKDFLVPGEEALKIQKIVAGIYQSARINREVKLKNVF